MDGPTPPRQRLRSLLKDPRHFQIAVLSSLLAWGVTGLDLEVAAGIAAVTVATALAVQWLGGRLAGLRFDPRSALISALSLTLLLRTDLDRRRRRSPRCSPSAASSCIRLPAADGSPGGKHIFNPTNFGIAAVLLLSDRAWVSPGQWGSAALVGFALACLGFAGGAARRAERRDLGLPRLLRAPSSSAGPSGSAIRSPIPLHQLVERRLPDLRLLHDLGPQDHARLPGRPGALRPAGGPGGRLRPLRALPPQRAALVAGGPGAAGAAARPAAAGPQATPGPAPGMFRLRFLERKPPWISSLRPSRRSGAASPSR